MIAWILSETFRLGKGPLSLNNLDSWCYPGIGDDEKVVDKELWLIPERKSFFQV